MRSYFYTFLLLIPPLLLHAGCATPTQPTGGEPDRTGPIVLSTEPRDGSVNFSDDQIRFNFDKYISRSTFQRAFTIEPDIGLQYDVKWKGRSAIVRFQDELPDSTTIIFRLGTDLGDVQNNRLKQPFTLATSTGPVIDKGEISGRVLNAETGRAWNEGVVVLYRHPFDFDNPANYAIQPDTGGYILFNYLREGAYSAFWVDDRNRNKIWDRASEASRPFPVESVEVSDGRIASLDTAYIALPDTIPPELLGVGMLSSVRLRLRFNEDVFYSDDAEIGVMDSLGTLLRSSPPLYKEPAQANVLYTRISDPLDSDAVYSLTLSGITDRAGNPARRGTVTFNGSDAPDTTAQRIIRNESAAGIYPDAPVVITYAAPITDPALTDSLIIIEDEITHTGWDSADVRENQLVIYPMPVWREGSRYQVRGWEPRLKENRSYDLKILHPSTLGDLELTAPGDTAALWHYRLLNASGEVQRNGYMRGTRQLDNLPEGDYILQAFTDPDSTGTWDFGSVDPYRPPERIFVEPSVMIRNRMTTELKIGEPLRDRSRDRGVDPGTREPALINPGRGDRDIRQDRF
jgi:hypothetical protein